ncbi:hypothetical protein [Escherichia coli ISC7]|uniref:Uncharacterized protein n=1 Tax=Escherichia coli ISC7 TaxID=1432555 RepID=W1EU76_ECOLX|nr:hypothetical protein [Escherichia coli ISC7]
MILHPSEQGRGSAPLSDYATAIFSSLMACESTSMPPVRLVV